MAAARVSVLMPVHDGAPWIARALESLLAQDLPDWELLLIDDGSQDGLDAALAPYRDDRRIRLRRPGVNRGLGAAVNVGLGMARAPLIAYLPADDILYREHLSSLAATLEALPEAILAFSGIRHHYNRTADGPPPGEALQMVQVMHRRTADRWLERSELVTDDLERMAWGPLRPRGTFVGTGRITAEWVDHPAQRHKLLREPLSGVHRYRQRYGVREPLRFHSTVGDPIDEVDRYARVRGRPPPSGEGLRILLVGELAYNPDRILALEARGHRLWGLWMREPQSLNTVGPLPFGHVEDVPYEGWRDHVRRIRPDVIYALLNWQTVPFAAEVLRAGTGIPFVWHFKEGPFICVEKGMWPDLLDLTLRSDGAIHTSEEVAAWFETAAPGSAAAERSLVLDGDLPLAEWHGPSRSAWISEERSGIHTVVPGRPIGLHPPDVADLAAQDIHLHFYGDFNQGQWRRWIDDARALAPGHLHLHGHVSQPRWTEEFSRYDAGWLHVFRSRNGGDLRRADWDDLNIPARMGTYAAAGLPMIHSHNPDARVAAESLSTRLGLGVGYEGAEALAERLRAEQASRAIARHVWETRAAFTFDAHVDRLTDFLASVAARPKSGRAGRA